MRGVDYVMSEVPPFLPLRYSQSGGQQIDLFSLLSNLKVLSLQSLPFTQHFHLGDFSIKKLSHKYTKMYQDVYRNMPYNSESQKPFQCAAVKNGLNRLMVQFQ